MKSLTNDYVYVYINIQFRNRCYGVNILTMFMFMVGRNNNEKLNILLATEFVLKAI